MLVFTVRRHRCDDYSGRYRVWLWAAICWFLLSVDETSSLHEGFKEMMAHVTGTPLIGDGSLWWVIGYFFLLAGIGIRLLLDMRECWISTSAMVATAGCYVLAVVTQLGWVLPDSGARGVMLEEGAEMVGNLFLLLAMGLHARHVILDAEGRLPERKRSVTKAAKQESEARSRIGQEDAGEPDETMPAGTRVLASHREIQVHPPHGVSRPAATRPRQSLEADVDSRTSDATGESNASGSSRGKLTKAEKKALRKKLRQMARTRQSQGS
jgi:hypothetical protein